MAVYVDHPFAHDKAVGRVPAGTEWCHMIADSEDELHEMARRIGMKRSWFQSKAGGIPHYDLVPSKRELALSLGAVEIGRKAFCEIGDRIRWPRDSS